MKLYISVVLLATAISALTVGCKKEYEQTPFNYTEILSFSYKDTLGRTQKATLKDDSIIVYWPDYMESPVTVTPDIIVAENAVVSPASGQPLQLVSGTPVTVTAQDGTKKIYYMKVLENIKPIVVSGPIEAFRGDTGYTYINSNHNIKNIYEDAVDTKLYAIKAGGSTLNINFTMREAIAGTQIMTMVGYDLDTGSYDIKIVNAGRSVIAEKALVVRYADQHRNRLTTGLNIRDGAEVSFSGNFTEDYRHVIYTKGILYLINRSYDVLSAPPIFGSVLSQDTLGTLNYISNTSTTVTYKATLRKFGNYKYFGRHSQAIYKPELYDSPTELRGAELINSNGDPVIEVDFSISHTDLKLDPIQ